MIFDYNHIHLYQENIKSNLKIYSKTKVLKKIISFRFVMYFLVQPENKIQ